MNQFVIGDIHGDASLLNRLLQHAGFTRHGKGWRAPTGCQALFLGDLIDRGPEQIAVLETVRAMVESGDALCLLGNHELNAIGWATPREGADGEFLRPHLPAKRRQHETFLQQVGEGSARHLEWIDWFRTLPAALDLGGLRAVHAWWNPGQIERLAGAPALEGEWAQEVFRKGSAAWRIYEDLTKGCELELPGGATFFDKDGHERREVRTQWWRRDAENCRDVAIIDEDQRDRIPDLPLPAHYVTTPVEGSPVFVGHYWLRGDVVRRDPKLACLDFSAAAGGPLVGYLWQGEDEINDRHFLAVR